MDLPLGRRRLLSTAAVTAGTTGLPSVALAPTARAAVDGGSTADGSRVITWPANGGTNQEWPVIAL